MNSSTTQDFSGPDDSKVQIEQVKAELKALFSSDAKGGHYVGIDNGDRVTLDGWFSLQDLRDILARMEQVKALEGTLRLPGLPVGPVGERSE